MPSNYIPLTFSNQNGGEVVALTMPYIVLKAFPIFQPIVYPIYFTQVTGNLQMSLGIVSNTEEKGSREEIGFF